MSKDSYNFFTKSQGKIRKKLNFTRKRCISQKRSAAIFFAFMRLLTKKSVRYQMVRGSNHFQKSYLNLIVYELFLIKLNNQRLSRRAETNIMKDILK